MTLIQRLTSTPEDKRVFEQERVIFEATELISKLMEEQDVSKAELARRLNTSKANITQLLGGSRNMTLRSMADVIFHLDASLCLTTKSLTPDEGWLDVTFRIRGGTSWKVHADPSPKPRFTGVYPTLSTRMGA